MEINQATQTFLLFFFIFVTSLLGFSIYIKKHEKLSKISLANAVETSILIVGIFALLVFGGSYYFVLSDVNASEQPLKDALSITASFFGGFATLTAAYIASKLFNDWRFEKDHDTKSIYLNSAILKLSEIRSSLNLCRSNATNLTKIKNNLIIKKEYINQISINHAKLLILLYADLAVISKLFSKNELIVQFHKYEKYINVFDNFNEFLLEEYGRYYQYYVNKNLTFDISGNHSIFRPLSNTNHADETFIINQNQVHNFFERDLIRLMGDVKDTTSYLNHIEECLTAHENLIDLCVVELKAKQQYEKSLT